MAWNLMTRSGSWLWLRSDDPTTDFDQLQPGDWPIATLAQALVRRDHLDDLGIDPEPH